MTAPSVIVIIGDDLAASLIQHTPEIVAMQAQGATFTNFIVSNSWCSPSRASMFTGRFPHSTGIFANAGAGGGYGGYHGAALDEETYATIAEAVGYRTVFLGKYINNFNPAIHAVAPGFSAPDWHASDDGFGGFNWDSGSVGDVTSYGAAEEDYCTDVLAGLAVDAIETTPLETPLLMVLSTFAPHEPSVPAPRHDALFGSLAYPGIALPSWDFRPSETDPEWLQAVPALANPSGSGQTSNYRDMARSMQAVSDAIAAINAETFYGHVKFAPGGQINSLQPPVLQLVGGKPVVLWPDAIKSGELRFLPK